GMATATYPAHRREASALARILADGTAQVRSGTQDLGTGTYTVMTQVAADALGLPPERIDFELGDTLMPKAGVSGGSTTAASVGPAVQKACQEALGKLVSLAVNGPDAPLSGVRFEDVTVQNGWLAPRNDPARRISFAGVIARNGGRPVEAQAEAKE